MICPAVHVRPLRGLSTLLALSPGRSRSWWLASRRPRARSTTWGHSWCDPSRVSARTELTVVCPYGVSAAPVPFLWCCRCARSPPYGGGLEGAFGYTLSVFDPGGVAPSITPGRRGDGRVSVARPHGTERPGVTGGR